MQAVAKQQDAFQNDLYLKVKSLQKENLKLWTKNDFIEQYGRREIIEILNIPKEKREDIHKIVLDFFYYNLGLRINPEEISVIHRMNIPGEKHPPIYVKFISRKLKNLVMSKKKYLRGQKNRHGEEFFIRENLTQYRRELFEEAKDSLKSWRYVWTKEGNIFVRKSANSKTFKILTFEDLDIIISNSLQHIESMET